MGNHSDPFDQGAAAKRNGKTWFDCPFTDWHRRSQWFLGWDSASQEQS